MNVAELLEQQARTRPDQIAIIETGEQGEVQISYAQLQQAVLHASGFFEQQGLRQGQAVLLFQPMSICLYVYLLACFRLGLIAMFIDPGMGRSYIAQCCSIFPPSALLASPKAHLLRLVSPALRKIPLKFSTGIWLPATRSANWQDKKLYSDRCVSGESDIALLSFTSGSTGKPKCAARSHDFLLAQSHVLIKSLSLLEKQLDMNSLPVFVLANLAAGLTSLIPAGDLRKPSDLDAQALIQQIEKHKPDRISAPPSLMENIADTCIKQGLSLNEKIRFFTGGAPVFPRLLKKLADVAPRADITAVYGSTEAEPIAHIEFHQISGNDFVAMGEGRGLLAGHVIDDIDLRIIRSEVDVSVGQLRAEQFLQMTQGDHDTGEIVVSGGHVLKGYLHGVGDSETKFLVDGVVWHRTGDMGYLDDRRRLWLLGRQKAVVNDRHGDTYPFSIECAAMQNPAVKRAAFLSWQGKRLLVIEAEASFHKDSMKTLLFKEKIDQLLMITKMPLDRRHHAKINYPEIKHWLAKQSAT